MEVVAMRRKDAMRQNTPFSISVTMDTTPPEIGTFPSISMGALSKKGLNRPTAITRGRTMRSL